MGTSPLATPKATIAVLERHGLYTKKALGQHFLVDDNIVGRIIELAALPTDQVVLEVGPGIGTLTLALCQAARAVVAVERDESLAPVLSDTTSACENLAVVLADAVTVTAERISEPWGPPSALVANLPYQVAATVVLRFFELLPTMQQATVMVQAEVADRMFAQPGNKNYGSYTVKLRLHARPAGRFAVGRGCFLPPPRVESAVIRLERAPLVDDPALLSRAAGLADAAFAQRRKTIRNSMKSALALPADILEEALESVGIDPGSRAETIEPEGYIELAKILHM